MSASRALRVAFSFILLLTLIGGLAPRAAVASTALPLPASMAAVGDSITQAASSGGSLGADYPNNSWSTGGSSTVYSHLLRLRAEGANPTATNLSVSGAKVADLATQMQAATILQPKPDYLTVLIGGNDLCTDTVADMTSVDDFRTRFVSAMQALKDGSPGTNVYVVSIPEVWQLWNLFKGSFWARFIWSSAQICQSLLANPTSTQPVDAARRQAVRDRNEVYNTVLAEVCGSDAFKARCLFDGNAAFSTTFAAEPPANVAPTAAFTSSCTDLTCNFTDGSTDTGGTIVGRSWNFGDGATTSTATNPSNTYAVAGTCTASLTVTDNDGATGMTSRTVTVSAPSAAKMRVADLSGVATAVNRNTWRATVTITVTDTTNAVVSNATVSGSFTPGGSTGCTTSAAGSCTVNVSLGRKVASTTFTVSGMTGPLVYDPVQNQKDSVTISRPS